jgi:hypothetical protein
MLWRYHRLGDTEEPKAIVRAARVVDESDLNCLQK